MPSASASLVASQPALATAGARSLYKSSLRAHPRPPQTAAHPLPPPAQLHSSTSASPKPARRQRSCPLPAAAAQPAPAVQSGRPGDEYFTAADSRPIILFDGVCNLCNGGVNFMLQWDRDGVYRFAALQSDAGRKLLQRSGRRPDDISSIVLVEEGGSYIKAAAVLRIASRLRLPLPVVAAALDVFPGPFKDFVYDGVAANRYLLFGRTPSCRLSDPRFEERFVSS